MSMCMCLCLLTSVAIESCWLELCPVTLISHTGRCGRQATLHNLAQMQVGTLQPNAELEAVTPLNPAAIVFPWTSPYGFPIKNVSPWLASWMVCKDPSEPWILVWRGARNSLHTVWQFHFLEVIPCFAKACLGLFSIFLFAFLSGDDAWCLSKAQSGEKIEKIA